MYRTRFYFFGLMLFVLCVSCAEIIESEPQTATQVTEGDAFREQQMSGRMQTRSGVSGGSGGGMSSGQLPPGAGPDLKRMQQMRNRMYGGGMATEAGGSYTKQQAGSSLQNINQGKKLFKEKKYEEAAVEFEKFLRNREFDDLSPEALYYLGECYYRLENYQQAVRAYKKIDQFFTLYPLAPDALYRTAECYEKLNKPEAARKVLKHLKTKYPQFDSAKYEKQG